MGDGCLAGREVKEAVKRVASLDASQALRATCETLLSALGD